MPWKTAICLLVLSFLGAMGCQKQCFMTEGDYRDTLIPGIPPNLECDPSVSMVPGHSNTPAPATVFDPNRKPRYLSLREAIAIALEQGTFAGAASSANGGGTTTTGDNLVSFAGGGLSNPSPPIRVLALDPAIVATNIETSLSKFDARWESSLTWNHTETALNSPFAALQAGRAAESITNDNVAVSTGLIKPLPTGGVAGITFMTQADRTSGLATFNPAIQPSLQFTFEQPLLQGFGVEINQLREAHPGSLLTPFPVGGQAEGILITRLRLDQQRTEFEREVNLLLWNVELAYWNLYNAYYQLYSREEGMRQAFGVWQINQKRFEAGRIPEQDIAQFRLQYETFRGQRLAALGDVLESERALRILLGLRVEDGCRLIPTDTPTLAPYEPNWCQALNDTLTSRPELSLARQDVKFHQLDLIKLKNQLLPDLRFFSSYELHALGGELSGGPNPGNAFHELVSDPLQNVQMGLRMDMPIGYRAAHAAVQAGRLNLARSYEILRDQEIKAERYLGLTYRQIQEFQAQIQIQRAALEAATIEVRRRQEENAAGRGDPTALLLAQRDWTTTLGTLYSAIRDYNQALVNFEFAKGTIMQHDSVVISEGPLPQCAQVRAVEHERERTAALVVAERQHPVGYTPAPYKENPSFPGLPQVSVDKPASLPALLQDRPPVPDYPGLMKDQGLGRMDDATTPRMWPTSTAATTSYPGLR